MDWTWWLILVFVIMQLVIDRMRRDKARMRHEKLVAVLKDKAEHNMYLGDYWRDAAEDKTKTSTERMTALHKATVLHGSSIAYQDAAQDVDSFLVHGERLGQRGAIKVDEKAVKPVVAGAA